MEEFDALMIRVNNIYYGRGKLIMSPEYPNEKPESSCSSSRGSPEHSHGISNNLNDKGETSDTDLREIEKENSISSRNHNPAKVFVLDNVVKLSQDSGCLGFEGSHKGHSSALDVDKEMTGPMGDNIGQNSLRFTKNDKASNSKPLLKSSPYSGELNNTIAGRPSLKTYGSNRVGKTAGAQSAGNMFDNWKSGSEISNNNMTGRSLKDWKTFASEDSGNRIGKVASGNLKTSEVDRRRLDHDSGSNNPGSNRPDRGRVLDVSGSRQGDSIADRRNVSDNSVRNNLDSSRSCQEPGNERGSDVLSGRDALSGNSVGCGEQGSQIRNAKPLKIDEKLLSNPWLSGEIAERGEKQAQKRPRSCFYDASLIFRDKLRKWKSEHDICKGWDGLEKDVITECGVPQRDKFGIKNKQRDLNNNNELLGKNLTGRQEERTAVNEKSGGETKKFWEERVEEKDEVGRARSPSKAEKLCLTKSKSKSYGNLTSSFLEKQTGYQRDGEEVVRDKMTRDIKSFEPVPVNAAKLKPAKSLSNLIGHFEDLIDGTAIKDPESKERIAYPQERFCLDHEDRSECMRDRHGGCWKKEVAELQPIIVKDIGLEEGGLEDVFKEKRGHGQGKDEMKGNLLGGYGNDYAGRIFPKNGGSRNVNIDAKGGFLEWPESIRPFGSRTVSVSSDNKSFRSLGSSDLTLNARDDSNERKAERSGPRAGKARWSLSDNKGADFRQKSDRFGDDITVIPYENISDLGVNRMSFDKTKSMSDLTQTYEPLKRSHAFYKERFERAASHSRIDEPSFDARIVHWRSLEELRTRFEANRSESLEGRESVEGSDLENVDGMLTEIVRRR